MSYENTGPRARGTWSLAHTTQQLVEDHSAGPDTLVAVGKSEMTVFIPCGDGQDDLHVTIPGGTVAMRVPHGTDEASARELLLERIELDRQDIGAHYMGDHYVSGEHRFAYEDLRLTEVRLLTKRQLQRRRLLDVPLYAPRGPRFAALAPNRGAGNCVVNLVWGFVCTLGPFRVAYGDEAQGKPRIASELRELGAGHEGDGVTGAQLAAWVHTHGKGRLGLVLVDPAGRTFYRWAPPHGAHDVLGARVADDHVFPVTDADAKRSLAQRGLGAFASPVWHARVDMGPDEHAVMDVRGLDSDVAARRLLRASKRYVFVHSTAADGKLYRLDGLAAAFQQAAGVYVEPEYKGERMTAFREPASGFVVLLRVDYLQTVSACARMVSPTLPTWMFQFRGQTIATLAANFFRVRLGALPLSRLSPRVARLFARFPLGPLSCTYTDPPAGGSCFGIDRRRAYSHALLTNDIDWPVFDACAQLEPFAPTDWAQVRKGAWCVVLEPITVTFFPRPLRLVLYPAPLVVYLAGLGADVCSLRLDQIRYKLVPTRTLRADLFRAPVAELYEILGPDAKALVNTFTGLLGRRATTTARGFVTTSFEVADAVFLDALREGALDRVRVEDARPGAYSVRVRHTAPLWEHHGPLYRHVLALGIVGTLQIHQLVQTANIPGVVLPVGALTDCQALHAADPDAAKALLRADVRFDWWDKAAPVLESIGCLRLQDDVHLPDYARCTQRHGRRSRATEQLVATFVEDYVGLGPVDELARDDLLAEPRGCMVTGAAGSGKTHMLGEMRRALLGSQLRVLVLTFTTAAQEQLDLRGIPATTFSSAFYTGDAKTTLAAKVGALARTYDAVLVDEYGVVPHHFYGLLSWLRQRNPALMVALFGDERQAAPLPSDAGRGGTGDGMTYAYSQLQLVHDLVDGNTLELPYRAESGRYGQPLRDELDHLVTTGRLRWDRFRVMQADDVEAIVRLGRVVCVSPGTKRYVDVLCAHAALATAPPGTPRLCVPRGVNFPRRGPTLVAGMRVRSRSKFRQRSNAERLTVGNNTGFRVVGIVNGESAALQRVDTTGNDQALVVTVGAEAFAQHYELDYGITVARVQGGEIDAPFGVLDTARMTRNELNVALSRATKLTHLCVVPCDKLFVWTRHRARRSSLVELPAPPLDAHVVYRLFDAEGEYIGRTACAGVDPAEALRAAHARRAQHVAASATPFDQLLTPERDRAFALELLSVDWYTSDAEAEREEMRLLAAAVRRGAQVYNTKGVVAARAVIATRSIHISARRRGAVHFVRLRYQTPSGSTVDVDRRYRAGVAGEHPQSMGTIMAELARWWEVHCERLVLDGAAVPRQVAKKRRRSGVRGRTQSKKISVVEV